MLTFFEYWRSSSSWRVRWALLHKQLAYRSVAVDLRAGEQLTATHRAVSPMGTVPALQLEDGRCLAESVAIFEFLDEIHPARPLYPSEPWARARVRQLVELVNAGTQPLQNLTVLERVSAEPAAQKEFARHFNARGLAAVEGVLVQIAAEGLGGLHCVGDALTAADLFLVPQVASARRFGVDLSMVPRVVAAADAALATEHAAAARPENQPGAQPG